MVDLYFKSIDDHCECAFMCVFVCMCAHTCVCRRENDMLCK